MKEKEGRKWKDIEREGTSNDRDKEEVMRERRKKGNE
jgi:hypothetical protein